MSDDENNNRIERDKNQAEHADINLRVALQEQKIETLSSRIDKLEASNTRLMWIVIGAVVLAGLNVIMGGPPLI